MSVHHTKDKGDLGVLKAQVDLFEQGFTVLLPLTEHAPFDLVAYKDGEYRRIQVKYRKLDRHGKMEIRFSTCWADRNGTHTAPINKGSVDVYCVYCPDTDECYYLDPKQYGSTMSLRVRATKNNQARNVTLASDCRGVP